MRAAVQRLVRLSRTTGGTRVVRYMMVSVVSTVVSFGVLNLVYGLRWATEVPAAVIANGVATVPSYYLNRSWVWGKSGRSHLLKEVIPFWTLSFIGLVLSIVTAAAARHEVLKHHLPHLLSTGLLNVANFTAYGILWVGKFLIFDRLFRIAPDHDGDSETSLVEA